MDKRKFKIDTLWNLVTFVLKIVHNVGNGHLFRAIQILYLFTALINPPSAHWVISDR